MNLTLICDVCKVDIDDPADASLFYEIDQSRKYREFLQDQETKQSAFDLEEDLRHKPRWSIAHLTCKSPDDVEGPVWDISTEHLLTWRDVARWTYELGSKTWFPDSNWRGLIAELLEADESKVH